MQNKYNVNFRIDLRENRVFVNIITAYYYEEERSLLFIPRFVN